MPALQAESASTDAARLGHFADAAADASDPTTSLTPLTPLTNNQMSGKRQFPKLGEYYAKMLAHCPQAITAYGACIKAAIDAGALERGCCDREFSALKKCFREVRVKR